MKKNILLILGFCICIFPGNLKSQISLNEAVNIAISGNDCIKASDYQVEAKDYAVKSAWGKAMPKITFDFMYTHMNDELKLDMDGIRTAMIQLQTSNQVNFANMESLLKQSRPLTAQEQQAVMLQASQKLDLAIPHFVETVKQQNFPQGIFSVSQPIFTGGKIIAGIKAAQAQRNIEEIKKSGYVEDIEFEVIQSYLNVLLAVENENVRKNAVETIAMHADRAAKMLDKGMIALHDKLRADVALSDAKRNLYEASEKKKIAVMALSSVLNNRENVLPNENLNYRNSGIVLDSFLLLLKTNNNILKQMSSLNEVLSHKSNAEFADYMPTIFGYGFYNVFENYFAKGLEPKWGIGIGASYTIFNGFERSNNYQQTESEIKALKMKEKEVDRKLSLLARSNYMEMKLAEDRYLQLDADIKQADENLKLNQKRYETGYGTSLELLDAQLSEQAVELARIKALFDYYNSYAALCKTSGKIDRFLSFWNNH